ncbi:MAG: DUF4384 domain-containing protein [Janthinobacterium lividum]
MLRKSMYSCVALAGLCAVGQRQTPPASDGVVIQLEQLRGDKVTPVRTEHVFQKDDVVRFRLNSAMEGYVYVVDHATSGEYSVLFPSGTTSGNNQVRIDTQFYVPAAEDGWFQVSGPPGFDTIYFLLSPVKLAVSTAQVKPGASEKLPESMMPRCDDTVFQARGECVDRSAGATILPRGASLPPQISAAAANASRDLVLMNEPDGHVKITRTNDGPAIYIFRIAHK